MQEDHILGDIIYRNLPVAIGQLLPGITAPFLRAR